MAAPTAPTVTQDATTGQITFNWNHTGTETHFEVRHRKGSGTWTTALVAPKARFNSVNPRAYVTGSRPGFTWNVRALTPGATPTASVEATFSATATIDGTWLLPVVDGQVVSAERAWIGRDSGASGRIQSRSESNIPSRAESIAQLGVFHLESGVIEGVLMDRFSLTADEWKDRLLALITNGSKYEHILYVSKRKRVKVEIYGDWSEEARQMSGDAWAVGLNYRQVA